MGVRKDKYKTLLDAYNNEVELYNAEVAVKTCTEGSGEFKAIVKREAEIKGQTLSNLEENLGCYNYYPMRIVKIYTYTGKN